MTTRILSAQRDAVIAAQGTDAVRRFLRYVHQSGDCWLFSEKNRYGYGVFYLKGATYLAHRVSLIWSTPVINSHMWLGCHLCRNRACVAPYHLYWGTSKSNKDDSVRDGTSYNPGIPGEGNPVAKLTNVKVLQIWQILLEQRANTREIAAQFNVCEGVILAIAKRRNWSHVTAHLPDIKLLQREYLRRRGSGNGRALLSEQTVKEIWMEYIQGGISARGLAEKHGANHFTVAQIITGKNWRSVTSLLPPIPKGLGLKNRNAAALKTTAKVTEDQVREIRRRSAAGIKSSVLASELSVTWDIVHNIVIRKTWKHVK